MDKFDYSKRIEFQKVHYAFQDRFVHLLVIFASKNFLFYNRNQIHMQISLHLWVNMLLQKAILFELCKRDQHHILSDRCMFRQVASQHIRLYHHCIPYFYIKGYLSTFSQD